jgi:hypothetical protein
MVAIISFLASVTPGKCPEETTRRNAAPFHSPIFLLFGGSIELESFGPPSFLRAALDV